VPPFVGRAREVAAFSLAIDALKSGMGGAITLEGPRGSGKHRLIAEMRTRTTGVSVDWKVTTIFTFADEIRLSRLGLAAQTPRIVVVEHAELASSRDTALLQEAFDDARPSQVLLILLMEPKAESQLRQGSLATLVQRAAVKMTLQPLDSDEMYVILKHICGKDFASLPKDVAAACIELASGNPRYLLEIVTSLGSETPALPTAANDVASRSLGLDRLELRTLRAASVAGNFTNRQLSAMLKATQPETAEALQVLCDRGLLACSELGKRESVYRFRQPLWRFIVHEDVTGDVRFLLHRGALAYLSKQKEKNPAAMAEHLAYVGLSGRAVRSATAATDVALKNRNYAEAARWSRYVLRFTRSVAARLVARERLAVSLEMLGAGEAAAIEYSSGLHDAQLSGMPGKVARFAEGLAVTQFNRGRPAEALDSLARVLSGQPSGPLAPPRLLALAAYFSTLHASEPGPWLSQFEHSDVGQVASVDLLRIHGSRALASVRNGDIVSAAREVDAGLAVGRSTTDVVARIKAYELACEVAATLGDMHRAVSYGRETFAITIESPVEAWQISRPPQTDYLRRGAAGNLALYLALSGNVAEALELCERFSQAPYLADDLTWVGLHVSHTLSRVLAGAHSPVDLPYTAAELLNAAIESEQKTLISFAASALALQYYRFGEHEAAREVIHRGLESFTDCTDAWLLLATAAQIAHAADCRRARQIASTGPLAHTPFYRAVRCLTQALYGKRQHRTSTRISSEIEQARSVFEQLGNKYLTALCDACGGRSLGFGARGERLELVHLLEPARLHASRPLLSARQSRIVELVALGWSDRRVGETLGIAEGTVGVHLARIYRKLGVSSRGELRSRWHESKLLGVSK